MLWITTTPGSAVESKGSMVCMIGGAGNLASNIARTKSMPAIDATTSGGVTPYSMLRAVSCMRGSCCLLMMSIILNEAWLGQCFCNMAHRHGRLCPAMMAERAPLRPPVRPHQVGEPLEQIVRVARPRRRLGVILHGK